MTLQIGLGETVYIYDINRRYYDANGRIIERECYTPLKVVAETKVSWVLENGVKVNKKTPGNAVLDAAGVERVMWMRANAHRIGDAVGRINIYSEEGYDLLRLIAGLIGYQERG